MGEYFFVLVTGDRKWGAGSPHHAMRDDWKLIGDVLDKIHSQHGDRMVVIQGGALGADNIARLWAEGKGIACVQVNANWNFYGKSAGPIRNGWMLRLPVDEVHAFHHYLDQSKGTKQMVKLARNRKIPVTLHG